MRPDNAIGYYQPEDFKKLELVVSFSELFPIAEEIIKRLPPPISQVCGPISTGGLGSIEKNMQRLEETVEHLHRSGLTVFNQVPFESPMNRILAAKKSDGYDHSLLTDFYLPLFESGLVHVLHFLPDWQSSTGASWEHEQAKRLGLKIIYL